MKIWSLILGLWITLPLLSGGQTLLDRYASTDSSGTNVQIHGFMRGNTYIGLTDSPKKVESKSLYGEADLNLKVSFGRWGKGFADIRLRKGYEFGSDLEQFSLREGYVETYAGRFDVTFGQQIIVWGKADGINPTNQITPVNSVIRSPDPDDSRMGNLLLKMRYRFSRAWNLEALWLPLYKPSLLPWQFAELPEGTLFKEGSYPDSKLENSGIAIRLNMVFPAFDASFSYNRAYGLNPGILADTNGFINGQPGIMVVRTKAYRQQVFGFDFSTTIGSVGIRGEAAYRLTGPEFKDHLEIPNPDIQYVLGFDRFFGPVHIIAQYIGRYVIDFTDLTPPVDSTDFLRFSLEEGNRLFHMQQVEWSHSGSLRASVDLLHETMTAEIFGMGNFSTEEYVLIPKLGYHITDGLSMTIGMEYYNGVDNTLLDMVENHFNSVFFELKAMF